jgi:2'-5' RNA ligase
MGERRIQAVVFLPEPAATAVQELRSSYDPAMARRIEPHITIVYDVPSLDLLRTRLATAVGAVAPFPITLEPPACWGGDPDGGIFLAVHDPDAGIERLRRPVMVPPFEQPDGVTYHPHVTLVHPRSTTASDRARAWTSFRERTFDLGTMLVSRVDIVGTDRSDGGAWTVLASCELAIAPRMNVGRRRPFP